MKATSNIKPIQALVHACMFVIFFSIMSFDIFVIRMMGSITPFIAFRISIPDIKLVRRRATLIARNVCGRSSVTVDIKEKDAIHECSASKSLWESQNREMIVRTYNIVSQIVRYDVCYFAPNVDQCYDLFGM